MEHIHSKCVDAAVFFLYALVYLPFLSFGCNLHRVYRSEEFLVEFHGSLLLLEGGKGSVLIIETFKKKWPHYFVCTSSAQYVVWKKTYLGNQ